MSSMNKLNEYNIVIASVGGQGGLTLSRIIGYAALLEGYNVRIGETLGMSQRGGVVQSYVRFGTKVLSPLIPYNKANVILGLEPLEALRAAIKFGNENTLMIVNTNPIHTITTLVGKERYPLINDVLAKLRQISKNVYTVNATDIAKKEGLPMATNIVVLAVFASMKQNPLRRESYIEGIKTFIRRRVEDNIRLFNKVISEYRAKISIYNIS